MLEDRYLRIGLVASLILNGTVVSVLGYSGALRAMACGEATPKPHTSRLIEISMLAESQQPKKASLGGDKRSDGKPDPSAKGDVGDGKDGFLSDTDSGPMGKLNQGKLANAPPLPSHPAPALTQLKHAPPKSASKLAAQKMEGDKKTATQTKRNIKLAIKSDLKVDLGTKHLKRPGSLVTGGYHGVVDLRKLRLSGHLIADLGKNPTKLLPNKLIGKNHIKLIGKTAELKGGAVCIPTGGHTVNASDITVYMPLTSELTGTKFCVPGGFPGIPGDAGQTSPTGAITQLSQSSTGGSSGSAAESKDHSYQGGDLATRSPQGEQGTGVESPNSQKLREWAKERQSYVASQTSTSAAHGAGRAGGSLGKGEPSEAAGSTDSTTSAQQALQDKYEKLANGPVRTTGDQQAGGGLLAYDGGAPSRTLHLPEFHNDPTDRIPGVYVPEDQRRLVVSPKAHRGSAAQKQGAIEQTDPKLTHFDLTPISVGSHSTRGTIPWAPDSAKANKHKASRRVKGEGKEDGGGDGSGLLGEYFLGEDFEQKVMSRPDKNIDFDWSGWRPDKHIRYPQPFSVRWTGKLRARYSEVYTIYSASDDGARLWIGNRLVLSNWTVHAATEDTIQVRLEAGKEYDFKLEYFENDTDPAIMRLYWQSPSQPKEYIPQSCFVYPKPPE